MEKKTDMTSTNEYHDALIFRKKLCSRVFNFLYVTVFPCFLSLHLDNMMLLSRLSEFVSFP